MTVEPLSDSLVIAPDSPLVDPAFEQAALEQQAQQETHDENTHIARATSILAVGNIISRILGFARQILLSHYFGAGRQIDAYLIATTIPQDLYDLAISGHVNSALVPVMSEYAVNNREELWRLVSALLGLVTLLTTGIVLLLEAFAPQIVMFYNGGANATAIPQQLILGVQLLHATSGTLTPETLELTVQLLRVTAPSLIFLSLFSLLSGLLYAIKRFTWPAFGAAIFNGTVVTALVALSPFIGIERAAIGWIAGAIVQLLLQFGGLRHEPIHLHFTLNHPGLRRIGMFYLPVLLSLIIDVLINRPFSYSMASQQGAGNLGYMDWATSLREFPMGLVATAISIAILPTLARHALRLDAVQQFRDTLGRGVRLSLTLIVPAAVGMFVLAGPLIGLLFEHGAFTPKDTSIMSIVLRLYLIGIPFAAIDLLLVFAFYARKDSVTPAVVGVFSLGCYIGIALLLQPLFGFFSLMIADSCKHLIHMTISLIILRRRLGGWGKQQLGQTLLKIVLSTTVMALITYALARSVAELWPAQNIRERLLLVLLPAGLGGAIYFILASLFRLNELTLFIQAFRHKVAK